MNIVIIGAGDIGTYLASIFSTLGYGVVLIDHDSSKLEQVSRDLDVVTKVGSGCDWKLLEDAMELAPDLLIALTNDDESNLVACSIAKNLGYPQTIARVRNAQYFSQSRLNFEQLFSVDHLIGPEKLTAEAILNMVLIPGSIATESFSHGSVQMRTLKIPPRWRKKDIPLSKWAELGFPDQMMIGLIRRPFLQGPKVSEKLIFPHGDDVILPHDEVTFIGEASAIQEINKILGLSLEIPKSVVIIGGSLIGINLARALEEHGIRIRLIEKDFAKSCFLAEQLPKCNVIHQSGTNYHFLETERIGEADVCVACTRNDEVNFLAASAAKELGCKHTLISLSDTGYLPLLSKLGIDHAASPRLMAANRILSFAREKTIASMVSMYNNQAEIMEVKVSMDSKIAGIPIRRLGPEFPKDFLIVIIQSRGRVFIADGSRVLSPGDTAVVISHPRHLNEIKKLF